MNPPNASPLGFLDGIKAFFGGVGFVMRRPAIWGWAIVPLVVATVLFGALGAIVLVGADALADRWAASAWGAAGAWLVRIGLGLVGLVFAFLIAASLAQPLSGFALDVLARRQEIALGGRIWPDQPWFPAAFRSLRVAMLALVVTMPVLGLLSLVTFAFPPAAVVTIPLKFLVTGIAVAYDLLDYPLSLRGIGARGRARFIRTHFAATLGFGVAGALLLLLPGVGLLLLPFGVAGAARLVVRADPHP